MQVKLPSHHFPSEKAVPREETASSHLSVEVEIDQFQLKEGREEQGEPVIQVLDSEDELDKFSSVRTFGLVVALIASDLEEEEEMPLERKKGLRELLAGKAKGSAPKDALGSQLPPPLLPPSPSSVNPFTLANLKKRKKDKEVELVPYNEKVPPKLPKTAKGKGKASSAESKEDRHVAEERPSNPT